MVIWGNLSTIANPVIILGAVRRVRLAVGKIGLDVIVVEEVTEADIVGGTVRLTGTRYPRNRSAAQKEQRLNRIGIIKRLQAKATSRRLLIGSMVYLLLVLMLQRFPGERWWPTLMLVYCPQELLVLPPLVLGLAWSVKRRWAWAAGAFVIATSVFLLLVGVKLPSGHTSGNHSLRVMTWNLNRGEAGPEVPSLARAVRPDVICLQEADPWVVRSLNGMMALPQFRGWNAKVCGELVVLSRLPLTQIGTTHSALWAAVNADGRDVVVVCAHLRTPISWAAYRRDGIIGGFKAANDLRNKQTDQILGHLSAGVPTMLCGDLNTPPNSLIYRRLTSRLDDSFRSVGGGLGMSYPTMLPSVRIDYVMVRGGLTPVRCWNPDNRASNHLPLCADLKIGR